ncbi:RcnB family protein [Kosakonia cowanii]|jgi:nickel/cobalt homeostasis protein|uniref:RcnB family protein n=1 Tax=Kosakonia TaxID=1330547 RepID=UPI0022E56B42|nr:MULTISPECIES: RcnB family protein [Kosakonia]MBS5771591.1 RcnB family protein [Enterobacter cloacae]MDH2912564.1 RcnB family protein [Kosakonia sp. HypNH10]
MRKTKMMLLGALLATASATYAETPPATAPAGGTQSFEVKEFVADFTKFTIGDTVPEMYRSDDYNIKQWKLRNLPAPDAGSHWTYMGGNYVLITDAEGKILKAYNGDIFYHR